MNAQLNDQQLQAVKICSSHGLVLAGAGTGKTFTIIHRVADLLDTGVFPSRILVLTFTKKAAQELVERLSYAYPKQAAQIESGTFHKFCLNAIRRNPELFGEKSKYRVIDRTDQLIIIKEAADDVLADVARDRATKTTLKKSLPTPSTLLEFFSYARSTQMDIETYLNRFFGRLPLNEFAPIIKQIFIGYQTKKIKLGYLDFDDILIELAEKLEKEAPIRNLFKSRYDHILVDEFQDTNIIQWSLLENIINPGYIYCVGDDAQSIYSFRGAGLGNLTRFKTTLDRFVEIKLTLNYRSTQSILNLANHLLAQSSVPYDKLLKSARHLGTKPMLCDFSSSDKEAQWLVGDILTRQKSGTALSDIMVMVRSAWLSKSFQAALVEHKIPYSFIGGISLFKTLHVRVLINAAQAAINLNDQVAWLALLTLFPGIGNKKALAIFQKIQQLPNLVTVLDFFAKKFSGGLAIFKILTAAQTQGPPDLLLKVIIEELSPLIEQQNPLNWAAKKQDLYLILKQAARFNTISDFMDAYATEPITQSAAENEGIKDKLTLITIHSAKGLEAKCCYLMQAQKGIFPYFRSETEEVIEEERRVLYVALTRAKDELIITRSIYDSNRYPIGPALNSYFLNGLEYHTNLVDYKPNIYW